MAKLFATLFIAWSLFFMPAAHAEIETYTGEGKATMSEAETLEKVIERAKTYALRNAREKAGVYIRSQSRLRDLELVEDEVITLTSGILKIKDSKTEKTLVNDAIQVVVTLTVTIDSDDLQREIDKLLAKNPKQKTEPPKPVEKIEQPPSVEKIEPTAPVEIVTPPQTPPVADDKIALAEQKYNEADKLFDAEKYKEAIPIYDEAIKLNPNVAKYWNDRGVAYKNLNKNDKALENYNKATELDPNYNFPYNNRGVIYREQHKYKQALTELDKAIELNPNYATSYANRGWTYYKMDKHEEAIANYNKAIELNPKVAWYWNNRGVTYSNLKGYTWDAIKNYNKAIELDPNEGLYYSNRGKCYRKLGKYDEANADFKRAKELGYRD